MDMCENFKSFFFEKIEKIPWAIYDITAAPSVPVVFDHFDALDFPSLKK